jgi:hypothetical protein
MPDRVSVLKMPDRVSVLKMPDPVSVLKGHASTARKKSPNPLLRAPDPATARFTPEQEACAPATRSSIRFGSRFTPKYSSCPILGTAEQLAKKLNCLEGARLLPRRQQPNEMGFNPSADRVSVSKGHSLTAHEKRPTHSSEPPTQRRPGSPHSKKLCAPATHPSIRFGFQINRKYSPVPILGMAQQIPEKLNTPERPGQSCRKHQRDEWV